MAKITLPVHYLSYHSLLRSFFLPEDKGVPGQSVGPAALECLKRQRKGDVLVGESYLIKNIE